RGARRPAGPPLSRRRLRPGARQLRRHRPRPGRARPGLGGGQGLRPPAAPQAGGAMTIVAYVPDLMDRSKVAAAAPDATFVTDPAQLADVKADLLVLDLSRPGVLDVLPMLRAH